MWATETDMTAAHPTLHVLSTSYEPGSLLNALYTQFPLMFTGVYGLCWGN